MDRISFDINNQRQLVILQCNHDSGVIVTTEYHGETETDRKPVNISAGDFVMLINLYQHIKENDIKNRFINYHGCNLDDMT